MYVSYNNAAMLLWWYSTLVFCAKKHWRSFFEPLWCNCPPPMLQTFCHLLDTPPPPPRYLSWCSRCIERLLLNILHRDAKHHMLHEYWMVDLFHRIPTPNKEPWRHMYFLQLQFSYLSPLLRSPLLQRYRRCCKTQKRWAMSRLGARLFP